jgi:hypothetical protein
LVGFQCVSKPVPRQIETPIQHGHEAAEVIRLAAHEVLLGNRRVAEATAALLQQPKRSTATQKHLGWPRRKTKQPLEF